MSKQSDYHRDGGINLPDQIASHVKKRATTTAFVAFFLYLTVSSAAATQFLAWRLNDAHALDPQKLFGPFYLPWAAFIWSYRFLSLHLPIALRARLVHDIGATAVLFIVLTICSILLAIGDRKRHLSSAPKVHDLEGSAAWMEAADVGETEMLPPGHPAIAKAIARARKLGKRISWKIYPSIQEWAKRPCVLVGDWIDEQGQHNWLRDVSNRHLCLFAPTRSGKGCSHVVVNAFMWRGSLVVNDPKGEVFALTAWYRKNILRQRIFRIDLLCNDGTATCVNPMDWIRLRTDFEVADAQNLAELICDPLGIGLETGGESDHWRKTSFAFLTGVILHVLYDPSVKDKSLTGLDSYLSDPSRTLTSTLEYMVKAVHDPDGSRGWLNYKNELTRTCPTTEIAAQDMLNKDERERAAVMSSVKSYFSLYREPIAARNISGSDLSLEDIMRGDRAVTIYVTASPDNMERLRPFIRLFYNCLVKKFTGRLEFQEGGIPKPNYKFPLLLLMDELTTTLGKMPILANAVTFLAGYGVKLFLIAQNLSHLAEPYGEKLAQAILANMHTQIYYANNDQDSCKRISASLGEKTVRTESASWNNGKKSISEGVKGRLLLTPAEVREFDPSKEIVLIAGIRPGKFNRINIDYQDPYFRSLQHMAVEPDGSPLKCDVIPVEQRAGTIETQRLIEDAKRTAAHRISIALAHAPAQPASASVAQRMQLVPSFTNADLDSTDDEEEEDLRAMI